MDITLQNNNKLFYENTNIKKNNKNELNEKINELLNEILRNFEGAKIIS